MRTSYWWLEVTIRSATSVQRLKIPTVDTKRTTECLIQQFGEGLYWAAADMSCSQLPKPERCAEAFMQ